MVATVKMRVLRALHCQGRDWAVGDEPVTSLDDAALMLASGRAECARPDDLRLVNERLAQVNRAAIAASAGGRVAPFSVSGFYASQLGVSATAAGY